MPFTPVPTDPEHPRPEPETGPAERDSAEEAARDANAPLSFVPHDAPGEPQGPPVRIRTGRYGELDEHELIHLLDSIEDERARGRFRESIYISCFIWIAIAWVVLYGPRYLWHAPKLETPFDVLKQREVTELNLPAYKPHVPAPRPAPKIDTHTLAHLRSEEPPAPRTPPAPAEKTAPTPVPSIANAAPPVPKPVLPLPSAPQPVTPHRPPPVVAEAPTPQPSTRPSFNTDNSSAENSIQNAMRNAARHHGEAGEGSGGSGESPLNVGGVEILSNTQGVDFEPYLRRIIADIYRNWLPLIPEEAQPPLSKQGETLVRFSILPDGRIGSMHLDGSTHDDAINRSCWGSIVSEGQFPPLPSQFHGPDLELRIHYYVNKPTQ